MTKKDFIGIDRKIGLDILNKKKEKMMTTKKDNGYAPKKWEFDNKVTAVFDDMLERSINQYNIMRDAVNSLVKRVIKPGDHILDIGCSNGIGLENIIKTIEPMKLKMSKKDVYVKNTKKFKGDKKILQYSYLGLEISEPMIEDARNRLKNFLEPNGHLEIIKADLRNYNFHWQHKTPKVILSILTLMFIPIEYRQQVLDKCYKALPEGGQLILVEKILGSTAELNNLYIDEYLEMKKQNGYSQEEIDRKRYSLEGVLVPLTASWNEQIIKDTGFKYVDCFWRWMNFAGWVAIK